MAVAQARRVPPKWHTQAPAMSLSPKVWLVVFLAGPADVGMTLPNWHLEGNPVVLWLGPAGFVLVKITVLCGLLWLATNEQIRQTRTFQYGLWFLTILYTGVVLTNLWVLVGH